MSRVPEFDRIGYSSRTRVLIFGLRRRLDGFDYVTDDNGPTRGRVYFSVYYYTKCVLLNAGCATLKRNVCNIKLLL